jgi:hypothetical protein
MDSAMTWPIKFKYSDPDPSFGFTSIKSMLMSPAIVYWYSILPGLVTSLSRRVSGVLNSAVFGIENIEDIEYRMQHC